MDDIVLAGSGTAATRALPAALAPVGILAAAISGLAGAPATRADFRLRASIAAAAALLDARLINFSDAFAARPGASAFAADRRDVPGASTCWARAASRLVCDWPFDARTGAVFEIALKLRVADPARAALFAPRAAGCAADREAGDFFWLADLTLVAGAPLAAAPLAAAPCGERAFERCPGLLGSRVVAVCFLAGATFLALSSAVVLGDFFCVRALACFCVRAALACFAFSDLPVFLTDAIVSALLFFCPAVEIRQIRRLLPPGPCKN
ncbi:MAG: hypothetical protein J2P49_07410 [Methylocapsa sp.]|nr:hypothetical protein [Methylocapsa sp.]